MTTYHTVTLEESLPSNMTISLNDKEEHIDFSYWLSLPFWRLHEVVMLCLDKDPQSISLNEIKDSPASAFTTQYLNIRRLIHRSIEYGSLDTQIEPKEFLEWKKNQDIPFPAKLEQMIIEKMPLESWEEKYTKLRRKYSRLYRKYKGMEDIPLKEKERESLLKIVITMAVKGYKYNPRAKRNEACSDIVQDMDDMGVRLSDDTVRKWLRMGAELVPPSNIEN